ncbi:hypothetical protein AKJ65_03795 [candidate division MSBL1 archaeon SCGC-AAA259E19]|uniref:Sulfur carrier protein FdhD n=2 Tax=candidate division MSBL1 TaxID=215777 RepID=A0A133V3H9_9EURY|nr:hypothetical protein AKJ65_03795 [candidate division MSBL1 archaeon SCGC-AAA259E19]KXB01007.1 hypothetical protein AKJ41_03060 [candidate division MSBL1 archaeon SCGC-AAA259O05]
MGSEPVVVEKPYDLTVNGAKITRVFISPSDLREFAYGYLLSEGIVKSKDKIITVKVRKGNIDVFVEGLQNIEEELELRSSGCVGFRWNEQNGVKKPEVDSKFHITPDIVFEALKYLETELYKKTSGSHSACLINKEKDMSVRAVDVGRHNAFDKVIGKGVTKNLELSETILLGSGRQSAGMLRKAANVGIPIIVSKAAPLSSGIKTAEKLNLTLICFADDQKFKIFSGKWRIKA